MSIPPAPNWAGPLQVTSDIIDALRRRRLIAFYLPALALLAFLIVLVLIPRRYSSITVFRAGVASSGEGVAAGLGALAGQFGIALGNGESAPEFYAALLESYSVRSAVLRTRPDSGTPMTLLDILAPDSSKPVVSRLERGMKQLSTRVTTRIDADTRLLWLSVQMRDSALARAVAYAYLATLDSVQARMRRSHASAAVSFLESQDRMLTSELETAESRLQRFLEVNRSFQNSPGLVFEHDRLTRRVQLASEAVLQTRRQLLETRIQALNTVPSLSVLDFPSTPARASWPPRKLYAVLAAMTFAFAGLLFALLFEVLDRRRAISAAG